MKENLKNYWKRNGFYMVLTAALVLVLGISGIAGYRSGIKDRMDAQNAAEFYQAQNDIPEVSEEKKEAVEQAVAESVAEANAQAAETFGEETKMVWPVKGDILKEYSMDKTIYFETLDQYKCNPALLIKADVNQEVTAAFSGTVESLQEDSVNGMVVTVDMGNGYKAFYGQMKDLEVEEGGSVVKGQAIGNVAQPTKYFSEEGSHLYFGMTKDGEPVDPMDYLEK